MFSLVMAPFSLCGGIVFSLLLATFVLCWRHRYSMFSVAFLFAGGSFVHCLLPRVSLVVA